MKKIYYCLLVLLLANSYCKAQWVSIPDPNFVTWLNNNGYSAAMNGNQMDTTHPKIVGDTILNIYSGGITNLTGIQYFDNLKHLYCGFIPLTSLPNLPAGLTWLDCSHNQLTSLPSLPAGLLKLYCGANQLTSLPSLPSGINILACDSNNLINLPSLPAGLLDLYCQHNQLTSLPSLPSSLGRLYSYTNQLSSLPSLPAGLIVLHCGGNQLTSLPTLPAGLIYLDCGSNQLTSLPSLPTSLFMLNCSTNQLSSLPNLPAGLVQLYSNSNQLTILPSLPAVLKYLFCNNNQLSCLPQLPLSLQLSDFSGNTISCIPNFIPNSNSNPPLNTLPLCGIFNTNACSIYWNISGKVYIDLDTSCAYNANDVDLQNIKVELWQNGTLVQQMFTNSIGEYSFDVNVFDTFLIKIDTALLPYYTSCNSQPTLTSIISATDSMDANMNFGMLCKPISNPDLIAAAVAAGLHRPGQNVFSTLNAGYVNQYSQHCLSSLSGQIILTKTGPSKFLQNAYYSIAPNSISQDTLIWNVSDFNSFIGHISFASQVDTLAQIGNAICYTLQVIPSIPDINSANNILNICYPVRNGYDPNIKSVLPEGNIWVNDSILIYTIQFQNTGNDTAFHIIVRDTLSSYLDVSTLKVTGYSYLPVTQTFGQNIVFNFPNIKLVDSTTNEPLSHGYVSFSVKRNMNLPIGTAIENTAHIYFDLNPAIVTNTTQSAICLATAATQAQTICGGTSYNFYGQILTTAGNYTASIPNFLGCDSIISLQLSVITVDTSYTVNNITLTANASSGVQWQDCATQAIVATTPSFTVTTSGSYRLIAQNQGCSNTTACRFINVLGINNIYQNINVYPNPVKNELLIQTGSSLYNQVQIENSIGQIVYTEPQAQPHSSAVTINTSNFAPGLYLVKVKLTSGQWLTAKVVKE